MEDRVRRLEDDVDDVKIRLAVAEASIKDIREDIHTIKDDTKWLRRAMTGAIISGVIGGLIALFFGLLRGVI